jgi:hypothetical protein
VVTDIEVTDQRFAGHYQQEKYCYECDRDGQAIREPVMLQRVRALITEPEPDDEVPPAVRWRSVAWPGQVRRRSRVSR